jgi:hypothetical protein
MAPCQDNQGRKLTRRPKDDHSSHHVEKDQNGCPRREIPVLEASSNTDGASSILQACREPDDVMIDKHQNSV